MTMIGTEGRVIMQDSRSDVYKSAGVDITAGYDAVERMKPYVKATFTKGVLGGIGGFGGLFELPVSEYKRPVLVAGTDGVGTKLKLAFLLDKHDTVGIDCVAMCVNDVICCGAKPLFFLDYIAVGKNVPARVAEIVKGISDGCIQAGAALIGGETAEMPGFYPEDEYDLAGYCTGVVEYDKILDKSDLAAGDVLIGLPSSGVHSNGFSLVRKVLGINKDVVSTYSAELGATIGETLLAPTVIYVKPVLAALEKVKIKAISHITGGGFYENIPRMLGDSFAAVCEKASYSVPPIFPFIQQAGDISERDMYNTFNMGVGMVCAVSKIDADAALAAFKGQGVDAFVLGYVKSGSGVELL